VIVWIASYPRSGNTFLRLLLHRLYGVTSSTVYDVDGVAERLGADLVGYERHTASYAELRESDAVHLIKTHRPFDQTIASADQAICLVRDGRDAMVSWAAQRAEQLHRDVEAELSDLVCHPERVGAGCWGSNVLTWFRAPIAAREVVHFHELVADPKEILAQVVESLDLGFERLPNSTDLSFEELHSINPAFFRRGCVGSHREEMPPELSERFLSVPDNRDALQRLGYAE
jgi:hypothetical protein